MNALYFEPEYPFKCSTHKVNAVHIRDKSDNVPVYPSYRTVALYSVLRLAAPPSYVDNIFIHKSANTIKDIYQIFRPVPRSVYIALFMTSPLCKGKKFILRFQLTYVYLHTIAPPYGFRSG